MYCGICYDEPCSCGTSQKAPRVASQPVTSGQALANTVQCDAVARKEAAAHFRISARALNEAADILDPR